MLHIYLIHPHILISIILSPTTPPDPSLVLVHYLECLRVEAVVVVNTP